jgi:uridylate kinase
MLVPKEPDASLIKETARVVGLLKKQGHSVFIVVGGGHQARLYIQQAKELGLSSAGMDRIGIAVTRLNASMLIAALGKIAEPEPPRTVEAAVEASFRDKVPVMGGTEPGQTTDAVAAMLASTSRSDLLIFFSDVDGVYTDDPKVNKDAKKIQEMTTKDLLKMFGSRKLEPGTKVLIDPMAARLIDRFGIKTLAMGKSEIGRLPDILAGAEHSGTTINPVR